MKFFIMLLFAAVLAGCSSVANTSSHSSLYTEEELEKNMDWGKIDDRDLLSKGVLDSILMNNTFDFIVRRSHVSLSFSVTNHRDRGSIIRIYPRAYYMSPRRASVGDPISLVSIRTKDGGWFLVWSTREYGCSGVPGYTYGCEKILRNELKVDKDGYATLTRSGAFNDHKYPTILKGYITTIPDHENKWLSLRYRISNN